MLGTSSEGRSLDVCWTDLFYPDGLSAEIPRVGHLRTKRSAPNNGLLFQSPKRHSSDRWSVLEASFSWVAPPLPKASPDLKPCAAISAIGRSYLVLLRRGNEITRSKANDATG